MCGISDASRASEECEEPPTINRDGLNFEDITTFFTFSGLPNYIPNHAESFDSVPERYIDNSTSHYFGPRTCHKPFVAAEGRLLRHRRRANTINNIAACSWAYIKNTDENRIPKVLLETKCLCPDPGLENSVCAEVVHQVKVLRRVGCENGQYVYATINENINVACVAVRLPTGELTGSDHERMIE
ncbi:uncharacterized protein LOC128232572 [Mya arenaria]|nr:uncharacterized protein LOC128232572 [Mya arenaria]